MAAYTSQEYYDMLMALEDTPNCTQIKDIHRVTLYLQQLKDFTILAMSCRTNTGRDRYIRNIWNTERNIKRRKVARVSLYTRATFTTSRLPRKTNVLRKFSTKYRSRSQVFLSCDIQR
ncbi:hypothetical protein ACFW04_012403 [Cataglyphis niger]